MTESLFLPLIAALALATAQSSAPPEAPPAPPSSTPPPYAASPEAPRAAATKLTAENRAALRCSAAFAIVTNRRGGDGAVQTELRARGREFFVVTLARIMDEHTLDRAAIEREVRGQAQQLSASGEADQIMPACLLMLQSAGL
ncbi:MAG: hypothetical protein AAF291_08050 [Pseudomonadota bacterium]